MTGGYRCTCASGFSGQTCEPVHFPGSQIIDQSMDTAVTNFFPDTLRSQTWSLCYSSFTDDASTPAAFHAQCDQYSTTLTVASNSLGYTFGGYVRADFNLRSAGFSLRLAEWVCFSIPAVAAFALCMCVMLLSGGGELE